MIYRRMQGKRSLPVCTVWWVDGWLATEGFYDRALQWQTKSLYFLRFANLRTARCEISGKKTLNWREIVHHWRFHTLNLSAMVGGIAHCQNKTGLNMCRGYIEQKMLNKELPGRRNRGWSHRRQWRVICRTLVGQSKIGDKSFNQWKIFTMHVKKNFKVLHNDIVHKEKGGWQRTREHDSDYTGWNN